MKRSTLTAMKRLLLPGVLFLLMKTGYCQQLPQPDKFKKVQWYQMVMTKYKTESRPQAQAFIQRYFVPVDQELGRKVIKFDAPFGQFDEIAYFPIDSIGELNYKIPPSGMKWMQTFIRQQGNNNALKLLNEFESYIDHTETILVRQTE